MDALEEAQLLLEKMDSTRAAAAGHTRFLFFRSALAELARWRSHAHHARVTHAHVGRGFFALPPSAMPFFFSRGFF
jgi:hypothetical protein